MPPDTAISTICRPYMQQLLILFFGSAFLVTLSYPFSKRYFRVANKTEKRRRTIGFFAPLFSFIAAVYFAMFTLTCSAAVECQGAFDLNCGGVRATIYASLLVTAAVTTVVLAVLEWRRYKREVS